VNTPKHDRLPYHAPELREHGTLAEQTLYAKPCGTDDPAYGGDLPGTCENPTGSR
jgi:hypothetical protein